MSELRSEDGEGMTMKIGDRCFVHGYVDEIRKDTVIIRNNGGYFGTAPGEVIVVNNPTHPNWILCSERLPEDGRPVLIYAWNVHHVIARYDEFRAATGYKNCWVTADAWNGNTEINDEVIAWMPLPEPYQAEEIE